MSKFEDHLWREFVREHGNDLAQMARRSVKQSRRVRPRLVVGTGVGLVGVGSVLALVLGATTTSPAFAVTRNHDGTVTVSVLRSAGIAGANAKLHRLGIRAQVLPQVPVRCRDRSLMAGQGAPAPKGTVTDARWTIDPRQVPAGRTLALTPPPSRRQQRRRGNSGTASSGDSGNSGKRRDRDQRQESGPRLGRQQRGQRHRDKREHGDDRAQRDERGDRDDREHRDDRAQRDK